MYAERADEVYKRWKKGRSLPLCHFSAEADAVTWLAAAFVPVALSPNTVHELLNLRFFVTRTLLCIMEGKFQLFLSNLPHVAAISIPTKYSHVLILIRTFSLYYS